MTGSLLTDNELTFIYNGMMIPSEQGVLNMCSELGITLDVATLMGYSDIAFYLRVKRFLAAGLSNEDARAKARLK